MSGPPVSTPFARAPRAAPGRTSVRRFTVLFIPPSVRTPWHLVPRILEYPDLLESHFLVKRDTGRIGHAYSGVGIAVPQALQDLERDVIKSASGTAMVVIRPDICRDLDIPLTGSSFPVSGCVRVSSDPLGQAIDEQWIPFRDICHSPSHFFHRRLVEREGNAG